MSFKESSFLILADASNVIRSLVVSCLLLLHLCGADNALDLGWCYYESGQFVLQPFFDVILNYFIVVSKSFFISI